MSEPGVLKLPKQWIVNPEHRKVYDPPEEYGLRAVEDQEDVHLRLPDGLVHRLHYDYVSMTACDVTLVIEGASKEYVDGVWESWQTKDMITCLECLCEPDKNYARMYGVGSNPCGEIALGVAQTCGLAGHLVEVKLNG